MQRRHFLSLGAAAPLALTAARVRAEAQDNDRQPVRLRLDDGRFVLIQGVVAGDSVGAVSLSWSGGADVFDENRFDLSGISNLFRPVFAHRWDAARGAGNVALSGDRLVVLLSGPHSLAGAGVTLGAGDHSWDLPGTLAPDPGGLPSTDRRAPIGAARIEADGQLLLQIAGQAAF